MNEAIKSIKVIPEAFFDFFAYFLPGTIFLGLLSRSDCMTVRGLIGNSRGLIESIVFFLGGYVLGHILTTISAVIVRVPMNFLFGDPVHTLIGVERARIPLGGNVLSDALVTRLNSEIRRKFSLEKDRHIFFLCENFIRVNFADVGFLVRKRHAFEHLCRNTCIGAVILMPFFGEGFTRLVFIVLAIFAFLRYCDYRVSWPKVVYESFLVLSPEKKGEEESAH